MSNPKKQQVHEWVKARGARNSDAITLALVLEVIELRARLEKLEAERKRK